MIFILVNVNLRRRAQIVGPLLDVVFLLWKMPNIYNVLVVKD